MVHQVPFKTALKGLVAPNRARESKLFIQARSSQPQETISSAIFSIYLQFFLFYLLFISGSHLYFPHCSIPASAFSLILLLSHFNHVQLCATPETAAHQAPLSLGFSKQGHWSGLSFPSPMQESEKREWSHSVMSDSSQPHRLQPTRLLCPWDFPGKSTAVECH